LSNELAFLVTVQTQETITLSIKISNTNTGKVSLSSQHLPSFWQKANSQKLVNIGFSL